jgi:16S rRNA (uracil1498-N3)-methyltransferase
MIPDTHVFTVYYPDFNAAHNDLIVSNADLYHRLVRVLRIGPGDHFRVFTRDTRYLLIVKNVDKKTMHSSIIHSEPLRSFTPHLVGILPILKKEDLENTIFCLTEYGVSEIHLVQTHNSRRHLNAHDYERLRKIIIAAGEQAQGIVLPVLTQALPLPSWIATQRPALQYALMCSLDSMPLLTMITNIVQLKPSSIGVICGPESDFTPEEYALLTQHDFCPVRLTPTVLRAGHSIQLTIGTLRSILST